MATRAGLTTFTVLLLAGCAVPYTPAPLATNFARSGQFKLQAAAHWSAISSHIEKELEPSIKASPKMPLYIDAVQSTPFNQVVAGQLVTALVNDGYEVARQPGGSLKVQIDTQVVEFAAGRPQYKFAGERTTLVGGAWVVTGVQHTVPWMASLAIAGQDAYAWFRSQFSTDATPKTEIVVTISLADERRYYARYTSVYYVTDSDRMLYEAAQTKTFEVKGS